METIKYFGKEYGTFYQKHYTLEEFKIHAYLCVEHNLITLKSIKGYAEMLLYKENISFSNSNLIDVEARDIMDNTSEENLKWIIEKTEIEIDEKEEIQAFFNKSDDELIEEFEEMLCIVAKQAGFYDGRDEYEEARSKLASRYGDYATGRLTYIMYTYIKD